MPKSSIKYRILIISCTGGAGHIRAAEALHKTAQILKTNIQTEHYNILDFTPKFFKNLYAQTYVNLVKFTPNFWGYFYDKLELKNYTKNHLIRIFDRITYKKYIQALLDFKPDAIICTHFLPYISVSEELRKMNFIAPIFAATTDFDIHPLWIDPIVTKYFVHHRESSKRLFFKGIPEDKISVTGIPIMPEFKKKWRKDTIRKLLTFDTDSFTILILSGGFGIGKILSLVNNINKLLIKIKNKRFNLIIVCGKNQKLVNQIKKLKFSHNVNPHIYGFVNNVHELMYASNILISKSGGLTSSEAMATNLPMLIFDPIPGQEVQNANLITEIGAGWKTSNLNDLTYRLNQIIENPELLKRAKKSSRLLAKPDAAEKILREVITHLKSKT